MTAQHAMQHSIARGCQQGSTATNHCTLVIQCFVQPGFMSQERCTSSLGQEGCFAFIVPPTDSVADTTAEAHAHTPS